MSSVACRNIFFLITCLNLLQISSFLLFDNFGAFLTLGSSQFFFWFESKQGCIQNFEQHQRRKTQLKNFQTILLREKSPYSELFWSYFPAFGLCGKIRTRKTPNMDTFHTVISSKFLAICFLSAQVWFAINKTGFNIQYNQEL